MSLSAAQIKKTTFFYERWRAVAMGILETAGTTFLMLIALRFYRASSEIKAMVYGGGAMGLLISPFIVSFVQKMRWRTAQAAAIFSGIGGFCFLAAASIHWLPVFAAGSVLGSVCLGCTVPLYTQIMQNNYPANQRGHLVSRIFMIRIITATVFSQLGGWLLRIDMNYFSWILFSYAVALFFCAFCFSRCPSEPLRAGMEGAILSAFNVLKKDVSFRYSMIAWTFLGFASTMMLSLRVEFLANPIYGLALSATSVAVFTGVLPDAVRFLVSPLWGRIFDRFDIFTLQIILNLIYGSAYLMFFTGTHLPGLILGALVFGLASSGADVAWGLWATKFAQADRVAEYMSVHTFLAGVRSSTAPFVAFALLRYFPINTIALMSGTLILVSVLIALLEVKNKRSAAAKTLVDNLPL